MCDCWTVGGCPQLDSAAADCGTVGLDDLIFRRTNFPPDELSAGRDRIYTTDCNTVWGFPNIDSASSAGGPESDESPTSEMSSVQALIELALHRFKMAEGLRQVHPPWSVTFESPGSPSPNQIEPRGGEDFLCSMDQTSLSSVYLNLDALTSSSNEESLDVKKCEDFAVTIVCHSEGSDTHVKSEEVLSDEDFPVVFGGKDIRQVVRPRVRPPGVPTRTVRSDSRQEPSVPAVDLVTGKCKPGKVSRTVSTSPLSLDMTAMCPPEAEILQLGAAAQGVLPQNTVANTITDFDTSVAFELFYMYLVYNPDGIVLVHRYYITCLNLSERVVLKPSRASLYLEGRMLDLRIDIGLWSTLNQWGAPPRRAER